ncbi:fimbrial protein [Hallella absiana]|uniref:fimbrial protein n=1 Tax=Hallella absiana TaxID=2925336 RepID=UPI0021C60ABB|nr:fimbrial protein [Hallella absiana]
MKGNIFRLGSMAMTMALATMGLFASCSSDDTLSQGGQGGVLTVSVTPSNAVNTNTRAAATGEITNATENTVNRIAVGVFDSDGKVVKIVDQATTSNGIELTASDLQDGEKVLVAVNAPEKTFEGVTTADEFKAKTLTIAQALWGAHEGTANADAMADNNHIPMYGEGAISSAGTQNFTANVNVYHLVSKVSLQSIKVDLKGAYSNATFQPTEIFMSNVPSVLGFSMANTTSSYTYPTDGVTYESGEQTTDGPASTTVKATDYPYLSTGALTWDANTAGSAKTYTESKPVFYTMPNNKTAGAKDGATFLVIKGKFTNGGSSDVCYYPVYLNYNTNSNTVPDGGTEKVLSPNYNYKVNVVINSKGSNSPTTPVDNSAATVNISAQNFVDANQTTNVNGTRIGDYVFSDGKWGPIVKEEITDKHYPIAVIFSTKPSATDIAAGYRHGYAIALASAGAQLTWAATGTQYVNHRIRSEVATDFNAVLKDYDGRTETDALKTAAGDNFTKENYPSAWYALNFGTDQVNLTDNTDPTKGIEGSTPSTAYKAPAGTSGWYLGSAGQYYLVALNLGGNITSDMTWHHDNANLDTDDNNAQAQWNYITGVSEANLNQLNTLFNAGASDYATVVPMVWKANTYDTWYWTSTEFSAGRAFNVGWSNDGNFYLHSGDAKSDSSPNNRGVRPVLAF